MSPETTERQAGLFRRLYNGDTDFDIVGRTKLWFGISALVIVAGLVSLGLQGLNLGIEFRSGAAWEVPAAGVTEEQLLSVLEEFDVESGRVSTVGEGAERTLRVEGPSLGFDTEQLIANRLAEVAGVDASEVPFSSTTPRWGKEITNKSARALVFFLAAITLYVTVRFEFKMALATLAALFHDILVTVGIFSLFRFEVSPGTVVAFLTILGYSIYDGIVVFDKVQENTRIVSSTSRTTYSAMVNLSLNQTLMRSLNTQISAVLPMLSLLLIGSLALGADTLQEFALALVVGQISGAYSSLFIASPALALLKEREPRFRDVRRRIEARGASADAVATAEVEPGRSSEDEPGAAPTVAAVSRPAASTTASGGTAIPPRPRKKTKRR